MSNSEWGPGSHITLGGAATTPLLPSRQMGSMLPDLCKGSQKSEFLIQNPSESYMLATNLENSKDTPGAKQTCLCA